MNLIFHQAALGDFVLTWPTLRGLDGPVTVVAPGEKAALAARVLSLPGAAMDIELFEFARLHAVGGPSALSPAVGELFEKARVIISFVSDGRDAWADNVARLAPQARRVFLPTRPVSAEGMEHVCDLHRRLLRNAGVALIDRADDSPVTADRGGAVVIHPGSGGADKCWPAERFEAMIASLRDSGLDVVPVLGEAEVERWPTDRLERWVEGYGAALPRTLERLHALLLGARIYLGNDAGPTHLSAQMGVPTVAMFGPTDPRVWSPRGPVVDVLAPPRLCGMDWLSVDSVRERLRLLISAS